MRIRPPPFGSFSKSMQAVTERQQIARDGQRGGPRAEQRDALAVLLPRDLRHEGVDLALVVGGDALQAADGDRLGVLARRVLALPRRRSACGRGGRPARTADRRRARGCPGTTLDFPVQHVGRGVAALRDQPNVFRNGRMRRACPLAIDDLMEVFRIADVSRSHAAPASFRLRACVHLSFFLRRVLQPAAPRRH